MEEMIDLWTHKEILRRSMNAYRTKQSKARNQINLQMDVTFNALARINEEVGVWQDQLPAGFVRLVQGYANQAFDTMRHIAESSAVSKRKKKKGGE